NSPSFAHRLPGGAVDGVPEFPDGRMRGTPVLLELFDFLIGKAVGLKLAPGVQAALVTKCEVAGLAGFALRRILVVGSVRHAEYLARGDAIRLIARILGGVVTAIAIKLPPLTDDPG